MPPKESLKRKAAPSSNNHQSRNPKRSKIQESRTILAQPAHKILSEKGELDVGAFVKSREFEIQALEQGIKSSKQGLSTRAFQQVPRELRRRTASHNVKKLPKRLRAKAAKQIRDDNTPTGSARKKDLTSKQWVRKEKEEEGKRIGKKIREQRGKLAEAQTNDAQERVSDSQAEDGMEEGDSDSDGVPPTAGNDEESNQPSAVRAVRAPQPKKDNLARAAKPVTRFRKRQKDKTWLPTHIFHAKRAHMTAPSEPLWRFSIPLSPTEKVYRTTHRAATMRGCIAWDMSYMSTIMLDGVEHSLTNLFERMGVPETQTSGGKGEKWRRGTRSWNGWLREAHDEVRPIAEACIIWCAEEQSPLLDLDDEGEPKPFRRSVLLRTYPAAFLQMWNEILRVAKEQRPVVMVEDLRFDIGSVEVEGPQAAEALASIIHELPRKKLGEQYTSGIDWPTFARTSSTSLADGAVANLTLMDPRLKHPPRPVPVGQVTEDQVLEMMSNWPGDKHELPGQIFDRDLRYASCTLQSSQKAINRRKGNASPGEFPEALSSDPRIPALLFANPSPTFKSRRSSFTLLLPWNWILPFWYSLVYYPLSTGGNPRFGGLDEKRQLCFEQDYPWFPADFPGTQAGWNWELREQEKRRRDWEKRPKGKRIQWDSLDLGSGRKGEIGRGWACDWEHLFGLEQKEDAKAESEKGKLEKRAETRQAVEDGKMAKQVPLPDGVNQVSDAQLADLNFSPKERDLRTVAIRLLGRGVPTTCARIYRLPTNDERVKWLTLVPSMREEGKKPVSVQHRTRPGQHRGRADLKEPLEYPHVPDVEDLIGFITTGNFNLGEGQGTGIGSIALSKAWKDVEQDAASRSKGLCIVREAGASVGRLAEWRVV